MRRTLTLLPAATTAFALSGCVAKAALDVVTAPVKVASQAADWATTSQDEADRNRGRDIRKREEQLGKLDRKHRKLDEKCQDGKRSACEERDDIADEMEALTATLPSNYSEN